MRRNRTPPVWRVVAAMSLALAGGTVAAQEAGKPTLNVGDQWVFKQTVDGSKESNWSRKIVAVGTDGGVEVQTAPDKTQKFDASWNFVDPRGADYNRTPYRFPMKVGEEWSFTAKTGTTVLMDNNNKYKVVAYEPVTVPAGTFDCFKVEGKSDTTLKSYNYSMSETYWYCPKVNFIAKLERETATRTRDSGLSREKVESVLTKYVPKG